MDQNSIVLVDAYAQIYRGFFAIRNLSNSKGQPTNAIFTIAKFLLKAHKDLNTSYGAFVFDQGRPEHRMRIAPEYKANRPPMPDELKCQTDYIRELISAFGWSILQKENCEADDIIGSICASFKNIPVWIVTGDKDMAQLVDERVRMLVPDRQGSGMKELDRDGVIEKFAVAPEQIVDYLSMIGDSSDNIPGLPGVGPKTAAKLISEFSSLASIIGNSDKIKNEKLRLKVEESGELLRNNVELIKLKLDIIDQNWQSLENLNKKEPDWNKIASLADELELKSIRKEIDAFEAIRSTKETPEPEKTESPCETEDVYTPDLFSDA